MCVNNKRYRVHKLTRFNASWLGQCWASPSSKRQSYVTSLHEVDDIALKEKTIAKVRAALEKAGVEFIAENGGGAGVRLRKARRPANKPKKGD